jgi:PD-(D/E)XK nuclease superfamily
LDNAINLKGYKIDEQSGKPILEISDSGLKTFQSCPKKWGFAKAIVSYNDRERGGDASEVGSAMHAAIQDFMVHRDEDRAILVLAENHPIELLDSKNAATYSLEASTITLLEVLENSALVQYELAYFDRGGEKVPAIEIPYMIRIELDHIVLVLRAFVDVIVRTENNTYMAIDIKTATALSVKNFAFKYLYDWQITSYGVALNALLGIDGDLRVAVQGVVQSDREPSHDMPIFKRSKADRDAYFFWLLDNCRRIERYWLARTFPRNPGACVAFGRECYFHAQCGANTIEAMQLLINPSRTEGTSDIRGRGAFEPMFTIQLDGHTHV